MKFDERQEHTATVIKPLEKRLDSYVAEELKAHLKNAVRDGRLRIVLDLSDVDFVDSSGLSAIIATMMALHSAKGRLMVCSVKEGVLGLLRLTRMDRVIPVMGDADEALRAMSGE